MKPQNTGTKIRTVLAVLVTLNDVLAMTDVTQFNNDTVTLVYKIVSLVVNVVVLTLNTWYNNDYTPEAARATGRMRQEKKEQNENYIGDIFDLEYEHDYEEEDEKEDRGGEPDTIGGDDDE